MAQTSVSVWESLIHRPDRCGTPTEGGAMKVCLISPPTVTEFTERMVVESDALRLIAEHAPIGILSLAVVLEQQGLEPEIIDLNRLYYQYVNCGEKNGNGFCS